MRQTITTEQRRANHKAGLVELENAHCDFRVPPMWLRWAAEDGAFKITELNGLGWIDVSVYCEIKNNVRKPRGLESPKKEYEQWRDEVISVLHHSLSHCCKCGRAIQIQKGN